MNSSLVGPMLPTQLRSSVCEGTTRGQSQEPVSWGSASPQLLKPPGGSQTNCLSTFVTCSCRLAEKGKLAGPGARGW